MIRPFRSPVATVQFQSLLTDNDFARLAEWMTDQPGVGLRAYGSYDGSIANLDFLRYFTGLRRFAADALYHSLTSLDGLRHLPDDLDDLVIGQTKTKLDVSIVRRFKSLTHSTSRGRRRPRLDRRTRRPRGIDAPIHHVARSLALGAPASTSRSGPEAGGTRDLALLPQIGELVYLEPWMVKGLSDISAIGELTSLRYLFLQSLRQVVELPDFSGCTAPRRIHLETMKGITILEPLLTAPALEELAVVDGSHLQPDAFACLNNIRPCKPSPPASTVGRRRRRMRPSISCWVSRLRDRRSRGGRCRRQHEQIDTH